MSITLTKRTSLRADFQDMPLTYWDTLQVGGKIVHKCAPMRNKKCGMTAWEIDGPLADEWRDVLLLLFGRICAKDENYLHIHGTRNPFSRNRITKSRAVDPTYHCYFLSSTDDFRDAKPTFVISCIKKKMAEKVIEVLQREPEIRNRNLGFRFLADDDYTELGAGTVGDDFNAVMSHSYADFDSICGARLIVTPDLPATRTSRYRQATAGGVIILDETYYVVTCAHIFDEVFISDSEDDELSEEADVELNDDDAYGDPSTVRHTREDSHAMHSGWSPKAHALYREDLKALPESDGDGFNKLIVQPSASCSRSSVGYFVPRPGYSQDARSAKNLRSRLMCRESDWALTLATDSRYWQNNSFRLGTGVFVKATSIYESDRPPEGSALALSGISGAQKVECVGGVAGITFPWTNMLRIVWTVEYNCAAGDSGAWIVHPENGCIYGMVVAISTHSRVAYIIPAATLFRDILSHWQSSKQSIQDILPKGLTNSNSAIPQIDPEAVRSFSQEPRITILPNKTLNEDDGLAALMLHKTVPTATGAQINILPPSPPVTITSRDSERSSQPTRPGPTMALTASSVERRVPKGRPEIQIIDRTAGTADYRAHLSSEGQIFVRIEPHRFNELLRFVDGHPDIENEREITSLTQSALGAYKAGDLDFAWTCTHHALFLRKKLANSENPELFESFAQRLISDDHETIAAWAAEVHKNYRTIQTQAQLKVRNLATREILSRDSSQTTDVRVLDNPGLAELRRGAVHGSAGFAEPKHRDFHKRNNCKKYFVPGRVFEMIWREPFDDEALGLDNASQYDGSSDASGAMERASYIRQMVVVQEGHGSCLCLPINTYSGYGVSKPGIDQQVHAIIYVVDAEDQPAMLAAEAGMTKRPVAIERSKADRSRDLDLMSRVNFSRTITVDWVVKTRTIGSVAKSSMAALLLYWRSTPGHQ